MEYTSDLLHEFNCEEEFPHCPNKAGAIRTKTIIKSPKVLIVNIGRFLNEYTDTGNVTRKLNTKINYDNNIDLSEIGGSQYDLKAVIYHHGNSIESGHYTAHCREDGGWVYYDDRSATYVRNLGEPSPEYQPGHHENYQEKCYILFYQLNEEAVAAEDAVEDDPGTPSLGGRRRLYKKSRSRTKKNKKRTKR